MPEQHAAPFGCWLFGLGLVLRGRGWLEGLVEIWLFYSLSALSWFETLIICGMKGMEFAPPTTVQSINDCDVLWVKTRTRKDPGEKQQFNPWVLSSSSFGKVTIWMEPAIYLIICYKWIWYNDQAVGKSRQTIRIVTSPNDKRWVSRDDSYQHTLLSTEDPHRSTGDVPVETRDKAQRQYGPGRELVDLSRSRFSCGLEFHGGIWRIGYRSRPQVVLPQKEVRTVGNRPTNSLQISGFPSFGGMINYNLMI